MITTARQRCCSTTEVCRERLAVHGPTVLVAVADVDDPTQVVWKPLRDVLPDYWMTAFPDEIDAGWTD
jgi:cytidine deaminase